MRILSTKILTEAQRNLLLVEGISLREYDAIQVQTIDYIFPKAIENIIITSQNGLINILQYADQLAGKPTFCVGEKTAALAGKNGLKVIKTTHNSAEMADFIAKNHKNDSFHFFCGKRRRPEIEMVLSENRIPIDTVEVYDTLLNNQSITGSYDGVLFFSPSAVESFRESGNKINNATAYCIGTTTEAAALTITSNTIIANKPTIENVIVQTVKALRYA